MLFSDYYIGGREDGNTAKMFFQKKVGEQWVDVDESYYTDKGGSTWPNIIWFRSVSDSGLYRLKYYRYTATDNEGNTLYYVDAFDTPGKEYAVTIAPVELTITGVSTQDRTCDGTVDVTLNGGTLNGVLNGDDVSFVLGSGAMADRFAGTDKAVTTQIELAGDAAGNYVLVQPTDLKVTITCGAAKVEAKQPTCTKAGNKEYWYCSDCGKYYADADLKTETTKDAVELSPIEHSYNTDTWKSDDAEHWHECACGDKTDSAAHPFKEVIDKAATETEKGLKHEECEICGYKKAAVDIPVIDSEKPEPTADSSRAVFAGAFLMLALGVLFGIAVQRRKNGAN